MDKLCGVFVGYKSFNSSKTGKNYNVLSLLFLASNEDNTRVDYFVKDIFVNSAVYADFIKNNSLLSSVDVKREIVGDSVRYYI